MWLGELLAKTQSSSKDQQKVRIKSSIYQFDHGNRLKGLQEIPKLFVGMIESNSDKFNR